jgi:hypothetical protein
VSGSQFARIEEALIAELTRLGWATERLDVRGRLTSVRFLFYRLVSLAVIPKSFPGAKQPDQYVSQVATDLREAGVFPLDCIVDENRAIEWHRGWPTLAEGVSTLIERLRLDPWTGEARVPFLIVESRSLAGTLREIADSYRVNIVSLGGQASLSLCHEIAEGLPRRTRALVLTDLDKSGAEIARSAWERICAFRREPLDLVWVPLAITNEQVKEHKLTVIDKFDARTKSFHPAVETEALGQDEIERIVRAALDESLVAHGHDSLDAIRAAEEGQREELHSRHGEAR